MFVGVPTTRLSTKPPAACVERCSAIVNGTEVLFTTVTFCGVELLKPVAVTLTGTVPVGRPTSDTVPLLVVLRVIVTPSLVAEMFAFDIGAPNASVTVAAIDPVWRAIVTVSVAVELAVMLTERVPSS